jgi:transposase
MGFPWVSGNASGFFDNWVSADASLVPGLRKPILRPSGHIKKLQMLARDDTLDLWFEDECHFQQHGSRCVMWVPPEEVNPVVLQAPTRKTLGVFGAVCVADGRLVTRQEKKFNAMTFGSFLKQLLRHRRSDRKMVVVLDNARWHHAKILEPWLKKYAHLFQLDFLPPYSPELNSIERVWKLTRTLCTHNRYFQEFQELIDAVFGQFDRWRKPNETIRRLCAIS